MIAEPLKQVNAPYFHTWFGTSSEFCDSIWRLQSELGAEFVVRVLQGARMQSRAGLLNEFAAALQFPYYFGENWDALDECLLDFEWLPGTGYVLALGNATNILSDEPACMSTFLQVLAAATKFWASEANSEFAEVRQRTPTPFHVVFHAPVQERLSLEQTLSLSGHAFDHLS
jgi:RNAse (barnase) inhibitor barstar